MISFQKICRKWPGKCQALKNSICIAAAKETKVEMLDKENSIKCHAKIPQTISI